MMLMAVRVVAAMLAVVGVASRTAHADPWKLFGDRYNLVCRITEPEAAYTLAVFDPLYYDALSELLHPPALTLMTTGAPLSLGVSHFDATEVKASLDQRLVSWPDGAARMEISIMRSTGEATVTLLGPEIALPSGGSYRVRVSVQKGACQKAQQAF